MRHVPTIFLAAFMAVSLGTGLYGLVQHIAKASCGPAAVAQRR